MYNRKDPEEREKVERAVHNMVQTALDMEGTCVSNFTGKLGLVITLSRQESMALDLAKRRALSKSLELTPSASCRPLSVLLIPIGS